MPTPNCEIHPDRQTDFALASDHGAICLCNKCYTVYRDITKYIDIYEPYMIIGAIRRKYNQNFSPLLRIFYTGQNLRNAIATIARYYQYAQVGKP